MRVTINQEIHLIKRFFLEVHRRLVSRFTSFYLSLSPLPRACLRLCGTRRPERTYASTCVRTPARACARPHVARSRNIRAAELESWVELTSSQMRRSERRKEEAVRHWRCVNGLGEESHVNDRMNKKNQNKIMNFMGRYLHLICLCFTILILYLYKCFLK